MGPRQLALKAAYRSTWRWPSGSPCVSRSTTSSRTKPWLPKLVYLDNHGRGDHLLLQRLQRLNICSRTDQGLLSIFREVILIDAQWGQNMPEAGQKCSCAYLSFQGWSSPTGGTFYFFLWSAVVQQSVLTSDQLGSWSCEGTLWNTYTNSIL